MSETDSIDAQLRKPASTGHTRNGDTNGPYKRVLEALIVMAVAALIAAVWNLTQTATLLQASQDAQRRDIDRLERRVDTVEGRNLRGGHSGGRDVSPDQ